jgi:hypothetical protein
MFILFTAERAENKKHSGPAGHIFVGYFKFRKTNILVSTRRDLSFPFIVLSMIKGN